jgi:hypothetical protein
VWYSIIFVHGLSGDRERTWKAKGATVLWPRSLLPAEAPNSRVMTFGYEAEATLWQDVLSINRIQNHSMNLLTNVAKLREGDGTVRIDYLYSLRSETNFNSTFALLYLSVNVPYGRPCICRCKAFMIRPVETRSEADSKHRLY